MRTLARPAQQEAFRFPALEGVSSDGFPYTSNPTIVNGTEFYQIDTGKTYKYDKENNQWYEKTTGSGASSWHDLTNKPFESIGRTLKVTEGVLNVNTSTEVEQDNTLPITSAAVYTEVGNINALLGTI